MHLSVVHFVFDVHLRNEFNSWNVHGTMNTVLVNSGYRRRQFTNTSVYGEDMFSSVALFLLSSTCDKYILYRT